MEGALFIGEACNADLGHPCDAKDGEPCTRCAEYMAEVARAAWYEWAARPLQQRDPEKYEAELRDAGRLDASLRAANRDADYMLELVQGIAKDMGVCLTHSTLRRECGCREEEK